MGEAFVHPGPALVDVLTDRQKVVIPPVIKAQQVKGFSLHALHPILAVRGTEIQKLTSTSLLN